MKPKTPLNILVDIRAWKEQTATLTPSEHGAFLCLKMHYWRVGQIPDRDTALAQITGMSIKEWKDARQGLEPLFIVGEGEWFRTDWNEELEAAYAAVRKYSEASKTANKVRWDRQKHRATASGSESDRDSDSHPASLLKKTKSNPPSQEVSVFVSPVVNPKPGTESFYQAVELEQAVSVLEAGWKEAANV